MFGKTKITAGALAAAAVLTAGCGSSTTGQSTQQRPAPAQSTTQPKVTQPAYDTTGLLAVMAGPEVHAFQKELHSLMHALQANDLPAVQREARHMIRAVDLYLPVLRATNPGPEAQGIKKHEIRAVIEFRNAARDIIASTRDSDPAKWSEAGDHMAAAAHETKHVMNMFKRLDLPLGQLG